MSNDILEGFRVQYRVDHRSGRSLSALGFGCMRFPRAMGQFDYDKSEALVLKAIEQGVNYFDTAYIYANSEEVLGAILQKNGLRDRVYLATKLPVGKCRAYEDFDRLLNTQLTRLKTDRIDYYLMHNLSDRDTWNRLKELGIERWIADKKAAGTLSQVGFSFHGTHKDFLYLLGAFDWDLCMIQYNYMNVNDQAGQAGLQAAADKGLPVIVMEPLLGGKLATGLPKTAAELFHKADPAATPAQWALRWLWNQPQVTTVLSGMNGAAQLSENLAVAGAALPGSMTEQDLAVVTSVVESVRAAYKIPCTGCNYCLPCPKRVNIPGCFAAYNMYDAVGKFTAFQQYATAAGAFSSKNNATAGLCAKCGKCEKQCPQHIPIMNALEDVKKRMEPFWFRAARAIAGKLGF